MTVMLEHGKQRIFVRSMLLAVKFCEDVIEVKHSMNVVKIVCVGDSRIPPKNVSPNLKADSDDGFLQVGCSGRKTGTTCNM